MTKLVYIFASHIKLLEKLLFHDFSIWLMYLCVLVKFHGKRFLKFLFSVSTVGPVRETNWDELESLLFVWIGAQVNKIWKPFKPLMVPCTQFNTVIFML